MARAYPSAGSAFTYVGQEIHPALGYVTGWGMVMDYLLNPLISTILCLLLWWNLNVYAKIAGTIWMIAGLTYGAWRTRWFQRKLINFDFDAPDA